MHWTPFQYLGRAYDLDHLHPRTLQYVRPQQAGNEAITFTVDVTFSMHCFSRSIPKAGPHDKALEYSDAREGRLFDFDRYQLSKRLPAIIETLARRKCRHTGRGNFLTVEVLTDSGSLDYDIFFTASKSSRKGRINLYVQSAYVRDRSKLPGAKPIGFLIILHNTLHNLPLKA